MSMPQVSAFLTPSEYLDIERRAETKSEYFAGEMFGMSAESREHNLIVANVIGELGTLLKKRPCVVFASDQRVKVSATSLYTYPDVTVVCGEQKFEDSRRDTLTNPGLIVEVLSPSTEAYDRGRKFDQYRSLETLQEYVLIAQDERKVEVYSRPPDGRWWLTVAHGHETIQLFALDCRLSLDEVYDKVFTSKGPAGDTTSAATVAGGEPG